MQRYSKNSKQKQNRIAIKSIPIKSRASSHNNTFEKVYAELMHRKDNEFNTLQSPHLNNQIQDLEPIFNDRCKTALNTPTFSTPIAQQRKKYINIKQKIQAAMAQSSRNTYKSLKELFIEKQKILTEFLNDFTISIEKQCKQKGQILKYIWNTMINMLESISQNLTANMKLKQKYQLENSLRSHQQYQHLIEGYHKKQLLLNEKSKAERVTINSLVYELRFKRKEVNKLYRNQRLLVNKLNQSKNENLNLQSSYIDLMCSLRDVPPQKVQLLLKARAQIQKSQQVKFKVVGNKKSTKIQIKAELANQKIEELQSLYQQIKEIANTDANSPQLISTLIEASIENFGLKNDDIGAYSHKIGMMQHKVPVKNVQTQLSYDDIHDETKQNHLVQFGYIQKLMIGLVTHKDTQTYCQYPKKKLLIHVHTQVDDYLRNEKVKATFALTKVYQQTITLKMDSQSTININLVPQKFHKKSRSSENHKRRSARQSNMLIRKDQLEDFIEELDSMKNSRKSFNQHQELKMSQVQQMSQAEVEKKLQKIINNRRVTKMKKQSSRFSSNTPKQRYTFLSSTSSAKISKSSSILDTNDFIKKKSNFAPSSTPLNSTLSPNNLVAKPRKQSEGQPTTLISKFSNRNSQQQSFKKSLIPKYKNSNYEILNSNFLQKSNYFNIEIDQQKQKQIKKMFNTESTPLDLSEEDFKEKYAESNQNDVINRRSIDASSFMDENQYEQQEAEKKRISGLNSEKKRMRSKRHSSIKYSDQNEILINLCRLNYNKANKKLKDKLAIFKYHDEFTSVKDKIELVTKDVKELLVHKESILKKTINSKNLKNTYKILMMTFSKAYDSFHKGILKGNLIYPLYQSFAIVYGAINSNQIYKKMINFIAALTLSRENAILRFFLFFLGLDSTSQYSEKVTISEVYLCLKLLEKISVDGKVTLNIESICTDTTHIKQQLITILREQKIPQTLSKTIQNRVTKQLQNSCLYQNSDSQNSHLKLNIYNIILLIIQEVIKCKSNLKETFIPILMKYSEYQLDHKLPAYIIEVILSDWKALNFDPYKLKCLMKVITRNGKRETVTIEQFCSLLFECNLVSIDQLYQRSGFVYRRNWRIPLQFTQQLKNKLRNKTFLNELQRRQIEMFLKISTSEKTEVEDNNTIQKMKRVIFQKHYERRIDLMVLRIMGVELMEFALLRDELPIK